MFPQHLCLFVLLVSRVIMLFAWDITEVAHKGMNANIVIVVSLVCLKPARGRGFRLKAVGKRIFYCIHKMGYFFVQSLLKWRLDTSEIMRGAPVIL